MSIYGWTCDRKMQEIAKNDIVVWFHGLLCDTQFQHFVIGVWPLRCACVVIALALHDIFADGGHVFKTSCLPAYRQKWTRPANPLEDAVSAASQSSAANSL